MIDAPMKGTSMGFLCSALNSSQRLSHYSLALGNGPTIYWNNYLSCRKELNTSSEASHTGGIFSSCFHKEAAASSLS